MSNLNGYIRQLVTDGPLSQMEELTTLLLERRVDRIHLDLGFDDLRTMTLEELRSWYEILKKRSAGKSQRVILPVFMVKPT